MEIKGWVFNSDKGLVKYGYAKKNVSAKKEKKSQGSWI